MRVFRFQAKQGPRLGLDIEGEFYDLTATGREFADISHWLSLQNPIAAVRDAVPAAGRFPIPKDVSLLSMTITRHDDVLFNGKTSTSSMRRTYSELAHYLFRELSFAAGVFLLTGAGIVPPDEFTLEAGDIVRITIEGIGVLKNPVAGAA